jgi:AbrB family looped-hinge helix DNA binding protein
MPVADYIRIGKRGTVVIPADARRRYGLDEGEMLVMEESAGGLLLKPVRAYEVEVYTPERQAEFMLNNAVTAAEYDAAFEAARKLGVDPDAVPHQRRPKG